MGKLYLRILIYLLINLSKQDYEIVEFNDQNTTVSIEYLFNILLKGLSSGGVF